MHQMLERDTPEDFIIATEETNTLEDFVATVFSCFGRDWRTHVVLNETLLRPLDITYSSGDPAKAARVLGWKASKKMRDVVSKLVEAEYVRRAQVPM
jgi:GDPmannose 4,6-dehydratase